MKSVHLLWYIHPDDNRLLSACSSLEIAETHKELAIARHDKEASYLHIAEWLVDNTDGLWLAD